MASTPDPSSASTRPRRSPLSIPTSLLPLRPSPGYLWIGGFRRSRNSSACSPGAAAGLATITPAAGYVSPATAAIIGTVAGVVCYYACALKNKLGWDDALDVWGVHGVGGLLGIILLGVFASTAWNPAGQRRRQRLASRGDSSFFLKQLAAGAFSSVWALVFTLGMLWIINRITPVRVEDVHEELGLDEAIHGETAYVEVDVAVIRSGQPL